VAEETVITITRDAQGNVIYPPVEITQSQLVYWKNEDSQAAHWPYFPDQPGVGPRFAVGTGNTSDPVQPYANQTAIPQGTNQVVYYRDKQPGFDDLEGQVAVWGDFLATPIQNSVTKVYNQLNDATVGVAYAQVVLTVGGKPSYKHILSDAVLPPGMAVTDTPAGVAIGGTPMQAGENFAFTIHCQDALGNRVDETLALVVNVGANAAT
jgi:hypothetical protein